MTITAQDLQGMVSHWLGCPPNGYLGSGYGSGVQDLLQTPLSGPGADALVSKLREDIAIMGQLPQGALSVLTEESGPDKLSIFFQVVDALVPVGTAPA
jgi:hypothetical protein